jgi:choline dehydrogenase-like flavoprotein
LNARAADVLIVGAGPAGGAAALTLARAGFSVVCLEQGDWPDASAYRGTEADWELTARKQWHTDPAVRQLPIDTQIDFSGAPEFVGAANFSGVGGAANLYSAVWPRLLPSDFRTHSQYGYGQDWPISYDDLVPYYERTEAEIGISGLGGNPLYPPGYQPPLPPLPLLPAGRRLAEAFARLRWQWWPEYMAVLSQAFDGRSACAQLGVCQQGCPTGAKATADLTHWRHVVRLGGKVITRARVTRIATDRSGLACGAEWVDEQGNGHFQSADVVLLAANGVGTPRLLLASADNNFPDGLANSSMLVGRNLMVHPSAVVGAYFDEDLESWQGHYGLIGHWELSDESRGFVGGGKWRVSSTGGPLAQVLPAAGRGVWGEQHHRQRDERLGHGVGMVILGEDLAEADNRVELSATMTDSAGVPCPKITYEVADNTRRLNAFHIARATEMLEAAGAHTIESVPLVIALGHPLGTARMGDDPTKSVVDRWGMAHDIPNLGILDGSVFVTSSGVNMTGTICALASRAADHIIQERSRIPVPTRTASVSISRRANPLEQRIYEVTPFDDDERRRLEILADHMIPPSSRTPAPSDAGIGRDLLDQAMRARPDLAPALHRALEHSVDDCAERLAALAHRDPEASNALELVVAGGFYMSEQVRAGIGYPGQMPHPVDPAETDYMSSPLLEHVLGSRSLDE